MHIELQQLSQVQMVPVGHCSHAKIPTIDDGPKYTSLKDIIPPWPTREWQTYFHDANGFNSLDVCIKNQLVKRAASAYLQSTAILVSPSRNFVQRLWRKITNRALPRWSWPAFARESLREWMDRLAGRLCRFVAYMANRIGS